MEEIEPIYIYADLETEALQAVKLLQIAAITESGEQFSIYINPFGNLPANCKKITGLYFHQNNLCKDGILLPSVPIKEGLTKFKEWLASLGKPVCLVCHNGFAFDIRVLLRHYKQQDIEFPQNLISVSDTLPAFRKYMKNSIADCKLGTLAKHINIPLVEAHNAIDDAICLKEICEKYTTSEGLPLAKFLSAYQKPISFFQKQLENPRRRK